MNQPSTTQQFDPITLEIIQNSLQAISDEMFAAMRKTAMSAIIYEVLDMGTGITDGQGNLVTFAQTDPVKVAQRGVLAPQSFTAEFSAWNFSYDLTASYKLAPDILAYATYARSFKSGGINLNGVPADNAGNPLLNT